MTTRYSQALEGFLEKLNALGPLKERERMAGEVLEAVNALYRDADRPDPAMLQRSAIKLLGAYAYLGMKTARLKAEADFADDAAGAARSGLITAYTTDPKMNVTKARAMADVEGLDDLSDAKIKELIADEYEVCTNVAERTISLIQSVLRGLEGERRAAGKFTT